MQAVDLENSYDSAKKKINAAKTLRDVNTAASDLQREAANSFSQANDAISSQLDKIKEQQKRFERNVPTSMDQMLEMIGLTNGNGSSTLQYLKRKIIAAAATCEPQLAEIMKKEVVKALGCSEEQKYPGMSVAALSSTPLKLQPPQVGFYIPAQSIDLFGSLKSTLNSKVGKIFYERQTPSGSVNFKPFGGDVPFPMNKMLNELMQNDNANRSFNDVIGKFYQGESTQPLFDIIYSKVNDAGVSGDYFRTVLLDRTAGVGNVSNTVGQFVNDYFSSIKLVEPANITARLTNILTGAIDMEAKLGYKQLENNSKFMLLLQRILGLCFDSRRSIDVSGVAKVAELDGIDDSFYRLNEVDLRNIDIEITNVQNGVVEYIDCDNVKLPVDFENLTNQLIEFKQQFTGKTTNQVVTKMETILNSISENPEWRLRVPTGVDIKLKLDLNIIKQIPKAIAAELLSPKNLFPIFVMLSVVQAQAKNSFTQAVGQIPDAPIQTSAMTLNVQVNNLINTPSDFLEKFKSFCIEIISQINAIFLKQLFEILKRDIVNLLNVILKDMQKNQALKKYAMILRLVAIVVVIIKLIADYRKCKSLIDEILALLTLIGGGLRPFTLPLWAQFASTGLPGTDSNRAMMNAIEEMQALGIPTGTLPDGSPNIMLQFGKSLLSGSERENTENGKLEASVIVPPLTGGVLKVFGKSV